MPLITPTGILLPVLAVAAGVNFVRYIQGDNPGTEQLEQIIGATNAANAANATDETHREGQVTQVAAGTDPDASAASPFARASTEQAKVKGKELKRRDRKEADDSDTETLPLNGKSVVGSSASSSKPTISILPLQNDNSSENGSIATTTAATED